MVDQEKPRYRYGVKIEGKAPNIRWRSLVSIDPHRLVQALITTVVLLGLSALTIAMVFLVQYYIGWSMALLFIVAFLGLLAICYRWDPFGEGR